jgi:orotidine-5'-phosphate decarboxylase
VQADPSSHLIVALDVPTLDEARALADDLHGLVRFYKVGLELSLAAGLAEAARGLPDREIFADLKIPDDIGTTITRVVRMCAELDVRFLTIGASASRETIATARYARGSGERPQLLTVPFLSTESAASLALGDQEFESRLLARARAALEAGCDGLIVSGPQIRAARARFPGAVIVSPGIRPPGARTDDHRRATRPADALRLGADYLVVGRPIRDAGDRDARRRVTQSILDEMATAIRPRA